MRIQLDERELLLPAEVEKSLVDQLYTMLADGVYSKVPMEARLALKFYSRKKLAGLEQALNDAGHDGKRIRPPDGGDPTLHYVKIMLATSLEDLKNAILRIETQPGTDTIAALTLPGKDSGQERGPLLTSGNERERQDVGDEGAGSTLRPFVSYS